MGPRRTSKACGFQQLATLTASIGLTVPKTADGTKANACIIVRPDKTCAGVTMAQPRQQPSACF